MRLWGWLAFLRDATLVDVGDALPASADPKRPIDPTQIVWFYPGESFGQSGPVPTVQLKWLRRLEQDYEYLRLAADRSEEPFARVVARTLVRPVRVEPGQSVDPLLPLMAGTPQDGAWREGLSLVADKVAIATPALRQVLPPRFVTDHTNRTTAWLFPRERPAAVVTATRWDLGRDATGDARLFLRAGVSVYNPSDARPEGFTLAFATMPGGDSPFGNGPWKSPGAAKLPPVATYEVGGFTLNASALVRDLAGGFLLSGQAPMRLSVRDEAGGGVSTAEAVAPAAVLDERAEPPRVDGLLGEWSGNEAIIDGPMVQMHARGRPPKRPNRPAARSPPKPSSAGPTQACSVAFKLPGVPTGKNVVRQSKNFVETEFGRVWGEDACELLVQPVWLQAGDPVAGPLLLVVCKPDGAFARRRGDRREQAQPWQNFESGLRYAATTDAQGVWRAEVTLPWDALRPAGLDVPPVPAPAALQPLAARRPERPKHELGRPGRRRQRRRLHRRDSPATPVGPASTDGRRSGTADAT